MALKQYKPNTPGQRGLVLVDKSDLFKGKPVKNFEVKDVVVKEGKAEAIKEISNKLDTIEKKADELYEKVKKRKKKKKDKKKKKK